MKISELNLFLEQHKLWVAYDGKQGSRADLAGANLTDASLKGAFLMGADLTGASLKGAFLMGADLTGADLTGANLTDSSLKGAFLKGANLEDANLWYADLLSANLTDSSLKGAFLKGANLEDADFTDANLWYADLTGADLTGADLTGADLTGANLTGANLNCANLEDAKGLPDISVIKPGNLVELNHFRFDFWIAKQNKLKNFIQDSIGMIVDNNAGNKTFDMLVNDRIIRDIPDWVKYSGMRVIGKQS